MKTAKYGQKIENMDIKYGHKSKIWTKYGNTRGPSDPRVARVRRPAAASLPRLRLGRSLWRLCGYTAACGRLPRLRLGRYGVKKVITGFSSPRCVEWGTYRPIYLDLKIFRKFFENSVFWGTQGSPVKNFCIFGFSSPRRVDWHTFCQIWNFENFLYT